MEVVVDYDRCEGHGRCVLAAPEIFRLRDDDDRAEVLLPHPDESLRPKAERAARVCPRQAITVVETG